MNTPGPMYKKCLETIKEQIEHPIYKKVMLKKQSRLEKDIDEFENIIYDEE